jgi:hypothetical protein
VQATLAPAAAAVAVVDHPLEQQLPGLLLAL